MPGKQRGRPRDEGVRQAILHAASDLVIDGGYERLSVEAIAARAGVSKQTIYRWWRSKASVVAEAVTAGILPVPDGAPADTGDLAADLHAWVCEQVAWLASRPGTALVRALASASSDDQTDAARLHDLTTGPTRSALLARLAAGVAAGQVRADADLNAAADVVLGAPLYRVLARHPVEPSATADVLVDLVINGVGRATQPGADDSDE